MGRLVAALLFGTMLSACSGEAGDGDESEAGVTDGGDTRDADRADSPLISDSDAHGDAGTDATFVNDAGPCDEDTALVAFEAGRVCIDLYEGAIAMRESDGGETLWPHTAPIDEGDAAAFRAVPAHGVVPQGYISQEQAAAACMASGKRLCTLDEWTAACRGRPAHDYVYPYGDVYEAGACNEGKESPIVILFGPSPTYSTAELNDPRCDELEGGVAAGGSYSKCVSTYGAFDMHGNLHEWVDDSADPADPADPKKGSFMGGYFVDAKINGAGCTYRTTAHEKSYHDYSTGFRCCKDAR